MRRARRVVAGVLVLTGLAGCAAIPEHTAVREVSTRINSAPPSVPVAPRPDADPANLVRDFIAASANPADDHGGARQYLRPTTARSWDHRAGVLVVADDFSTVYAPATGNIDQINGVTVQVKVNKLGRVHPKDHTFLAEPGEDEFPVHLERDDNRQWRIVGLPAGVVVSKSGFDSAYQSVRLYFVQPDRESLVPDPRYLPKGNPQTLPRDVIRLLLEGPSEALRDAAVSALPASAHLAGGVNRDVNDALVVDLNDLGTLSPTDEQLIAAQVVLSLQQVSNGVIKITRARFNWMENRASEFSQYTNPNQAAADSGVMAVDGRLLRMRDGSPMTVEGPGGPLSVVTAALGTEGIRDAVVARAAPGGAPALYLGREDRRYRRVELGGRPPTELTRPTWRKGNGEVWTVADGERVHRVVMGAAEGGRQDADGHTVRPVLATELLKYGKITSLRLSRDGVRVAAVVGGRLVIGAVRERGTETQVINVRVLHPAGLDREAVDIDWMGPDALVVATDLANHLVMKTTTDGYQAEIFPGANLSRGLKSVAAAPGMPTVVADANGLWTVENLNAVVWQPHRQSPIGNQVVPIYPG